MGVSGPLTRREPPKGRLTSARARGRKKTLGLWKSPRSKPLKNGGVGGGEAGL